MVGVVKFQATEEALHEEVQSTLIKFVVGKPEATENGFPSYFLLDAMSHGLMSCDKDFCC